MASEYEQQLKILERDLEKELYEEMRQCVSTEIHGCHVEADIDLTNRAYILAGAYGIVTSILEPNNDE